MGQKPLKIQPFMYWEEAKILRALAVSALAVAFLVMVIITAISGILSGDTQESPGMGQVINSPAGGATENEASDEASDAAPSSEKTYVVEGGDSFYTISQKFNTSISEIRKLNPDLDPSNLMPGTTVVIP